MRPITLLVVLAVTPLSNILAQDSLRVQVGDRVRITVGLPPNEPIVRTGKFVGVADENLVLDNARVPLDSIARVEVNRGSHGHGGVGALLGLLIGGAGGALVGYYKDPGDVYAGLAATVYGGVGAVLGLGVGWGIGYNIRTQHWRTVPLDALRVSVAPQRDGRFAFGLSVRF